MPGQGWTPGEGGGCCCTCADVGTSASGGSCCTPSACSKGTHLAEGTPPAWGRAPHKTCEWHATGRCSFRCPSAARPLNGRGRGCAGGRGRRRGSGGMRPCPAHRIKPDMLFGGRTGSADIAAAWTLGRWAAHVAGQPTSRLSAEPGMSAGGSQEGDQSTYSQSSEAGSQFTSDVSDTRQNITWDTESSESGGTEFSTDVRVHTSGQIQEAWTVSWVGREKPLSGVLHQATSSGVRPGARVCRGMPPPWGMGTWGCLRGGRTSRDGPECGSVDCRNGFGGW